MSETEEKAGYKYTVLYEGSTNHHGGDKEKSHRIISLISDEVITIMLLRKFEGTSKNNIPWSRWAAEYKLIFSFRPRGKSKKRSFNVYSWEKASKKRALFANVSNGNRLERTPFANRVEYDGREQVRTIESEVIEQVFSMYRNLIGSIPETIEPSLTNIPFLSYSLLQHSLPVNNIQNVATISAKVRQAYRSETFQDVTLKLFGKKLYRKDLVKAVATGDLYALEYFTYLKKVVPIDWIITALKDSSKVHANTPHRHKSRLNPVFQQQIARMFKDLPQATQKKLLMDISKPEQPKNTQDMIHYGNLRYIKDAVSLYDQIKTTVVEENEELISKETLKVSTWKEIHDRLAVIHRRISQRDKLIPQISKAVKMEELLGNDKTYKITPAKTTHELIFWGEKMSNCISGYARQAINGTTLLAKVEKGDELLANMEIVGDRCTQLFGKFNRPLPREEHDKIIKKLIDAKLIKTGPHYYMN